MSVSFLALIKAIILPPTINFIFFFFGLVIKNKRKTLSNMLLYTSGLTLILFCLPLFSNLLLKNMEIYPALVPPVVVNDEQAIVVLAGGIYPDAREYGKAIEGSATLQRNNYAAFLFKQTSLPILVSGGKVDSDEISEAEVMADTLSKSFNIQVKWQEKKSKNTAENAIYSVRILKENNIDKIFLVTHAWHMPRSVMIFEQQGIKVTPAPTIFTPDFISLTWQNYIPSASALYQTRIALHEYIGILWYKLRY